MFDHRASRRTMLRATGAAALTIPFLRAERRAAAAGAPKKLVLVHTPNGIEHLRTLPPSLERLRSDLLLVDGIDWNAVDKPVSSADDHVKGPNGTFNAWIRSDGKPAGPSIDQYLVSTLKPQTKFPSVQLGVLTMDSGGAHPNSGMDGTIIPSESNPKKAFDRLFGAIAGPPPTATTPAGPSAAELLRRRRKSVLDHVVGELSAARAGLTPEERGKLDRHLESLRSIEKRLTAMPAMGGGSGPVAAICTTDAVAKLRERAGVKIPDWTSDYATYYAPAGALLMDMIVLSLACGLTLYPTLRWAFRVSNIRHTWIGSTGGHHDLAHAGPELAPELRKVTHWYGDQFALFIEKMKAAKDADGAALLDNTLMLWSSDMADGGHKFENSLFVIAGRAGGAIRPGGTYEGNGASQNDLFASLCHAMGATNTVKFGNPMFATGPLAGFGCRC